MSREQMKSRQAEQLPNNARMDAYYYGFNRTGFGPVDAVLSAVAVAGKGSHHTQSWGDDDAEWFYGDRPGLPSAKGAADLIQKTADLTARSITEDLAKLHAALDAVEALPHEDYCCTKGCPGYGLATCGKVRGYGDHCDGSECSCFMRGPLDAIQSALREP